MNLPSHISHCANQALHTLRQCSGKMISPAMDGTALLSQRAEWMQFKPATQISANGSCHLLITQDQRWIALNLSRPGDWELLPALFKQPAVISTWQHVATQVKNHHSLVLLEQGRTLGLPIAIAAQHDTSEANRNWFDVICRGEKKMARNESPLVVDLSSLWAGPLCSHLLQQVGARVIKIESAQRPDGAGLNTQPGGRVFYEHLNHRKKIITLNFKNLADLEKLKQYIQQADIVIEGTRPRALLQLGIDAEAIVKKQAGLIWISITGYGRRDPQANWVAFGDDAAISAGVFNMMEDKPVFIGDAIADPLTGLHAAVAALQFYQQGQSVLLDINLHAVARHAALKNKVK